MKNLISTLAVIAAGLALALPALAGDFKSDRILVTVRGDGRDVILIPGLSSSAAVWDTTTAAVPGYRYHVVQVKGFAGAPPEANAKGPVVAPVAEEIARYIATETLEKPAIVGHSLGGTLGMMVAARHPDRVSKLMVVDMMPFMGAMFMPNATPESVTPIASQFRDGITKASSASRQTTAEQTIAGMIKTPSFHAASIKHVVDSDPMTSGQAMYDLITTDLGSELAHIKASMRVLWALPPSAPISAEQMADYYRTAYASAPNVTIRQVTDSYHFIMYDQPEVFQTELKDFLK